MSDEKLKLKMEVRGSNGIDFEEGWKTGDMKQGGLNINTVWWTDKNTRIGGCIDRGQVRELRDYLNKCIDKWDNENKDT
jgi:hypothetical protein